MLEEIKETRIKMTEEEALNNILIKIQRGETLTAEEKQKAELFHGL